mgnify:CR=1 FL=1
MQRIKLDVFHSLFEKELTGNEIDFIIALTHLQNGRGEAFGVHYKEMCEKMDISVQAFYDCKKSLAQKGIIQVTKRNRRTMILFCVEMILLLIQIEIIRQETCHISGQIKNFFMM